MCLKYCHANQDPAQGYVASRIISTIINRSTAAPDLQKSLSSNSVPKLIETAINSSSDSIFFLITKSLLQNYPAQCGSLRQTIIKKLWTYLDSKNERIVSDTAKCYHLLQQVRSSGAQNMCHKNMFTLYHKQLIGSIHEYLNLLFANTVESIDVNISDDRLNIPELELSDEPFVKASQLTVRCENLISFLTTTLS